MAGDEIACPTSHSDNVSFPALRLAGSLWMDHRGFELVELVSAVRQDRLKAPGIR